MSNALTGGLAEHIEALSVRVPFSGCWIWMSAMCKGYGQLTHKGRHMAAHRASYLAHKGDPIGKLVCHQCDVRACVNPDHLYAGSYADNARDTHARSDWSHPFRSRTHCAAGHEYTAVGFRFAKYDGSRVCMECQREAKRRQRARNTKGEPT